MGRAGSVVGLLEVLCFLAGFSVVTEGRGAALSRRVDAANTVSSAYQDARFWVGQEESLERKYRLEPRPAMSRLHYQAEQHLTADLQDLLRVGTSSASRAVAEPRSVNRSRRHPCCAATTPPRRKHHDRLRGRRRPSAEVARLGQVAITDPLTGLRNHRAFHEDLQLEADWIRHHHSRYDGRGYPDQIGGDDIPLESRVILVADAFDAMTSDRPYREAPGLQFAIAELHRGSGTEFDPRVVRALCRRLDPAAEPAGPMPPFTDGKRGSSPTRRSAPAERSNRSCRRPEIGSTVRPAAPPGRQHRQAGSTQPMIATYCAAAAAITSP